MDWGHLVPSLAPGASLGRAGVLGLITFPRGSWRLLAAAALLAAAVYNERQEPALDLTLAADSPPVVIEPDNLASDTPSPTLAPTSTPTPTPTPSVHHMLMARRCTEYTAVVWGWSSEYPRLDPALVLAVAAKELNCVPDATDTYSASTGLMQINPDGLGVSAASLLDVRRNVGYGMKILTGTIWNEAKNPDGDVRRGLAAYNCGWDSLDAGRCYDFGGYAYADAVLEEWVPPLRQALIEYSGLPHPVLSHYHIADDVLAWLASWGYTPR